MKRRKRNLILLAAVIILAIIIVSLVDRSREGKRKPIDFTGLVEAQEYNIGAKVGGQIVWLGVDEGDPVRAGQELVKLDDKDIRAQLDKAIAQEKASTDALEEGYANLETIRRRQNTAQDDVAMNRAELQGDLAVQTEAEKEYNRMKSLAAEGIASQRDLDTATRNFDQSQAKVNAAEAKVRQSEGSISELGSEAQAQRKAIKALKSGIASAKADIDYYRVRLGYARVTSPSNGTVAYIAFQQGEIVPADTTILTIIDTSYRWVRFDIEETYAGRIHIGSVLQVRAKRIDRVFYARVTDIGREAEFATQRDVARSKQDIHTFRVRAALDDPRGILKPGMTVMVRVP
jgi:HlyD family secretion protein